MILSRYCIAYPLADDPASVVLFSTKKASIIKIPRSMIEDLHMGLIREEEKETLSELGFLAPSEDDEKAAMLNFMDELNAANRTWKAFIVLNLDCNLACTYCFEGQRKGRYYMSPETADAVVQFVKDEVGNTERGGLLNEIFLSFYGGEPLLSTERIIRISDKLKTAAEASGMTYGFSLTTNGTLLTPSLVERLNAHGLKSVSITIDGPQHIHDRFRPFRSGRGSFDHIVRNIKAVCDMTSVRLSGNYMADTYAEFPSLLDYLITEGLSPKRIPFLRFDPVTNETPGFGPPEFRDGCESLNEPWLRDAVIFLREAILRRGYRTQKVVPEACMVGQRDALVINVDGTVYKCPCFIGRKEYSLGDVRGGVTDLPTKYNFDSYRNKKCLECVYLPLCFGGCRHMKLVRDGTLEGVDCMKSFYDAALEALIHQDIKYTGQITR